MAREHPLDDAADAQETLLSHLRNSSFELDTAEREQVLNQLASAQTDRAIAFANRTPQYGRGPRRENAARYRVRVDLVGTKPPVWRRLELASDLFLDELHEIIQAAFGWTDSHLHRFGSGQQFWHPETEYYLCPFDAAEGAEEGVPEEEVRLDEVIAEVGDTLLYDYDFGDDWLHQIRLEVVLSRDDSAPRAVCVTGRRPGPPEDCGGPGGYEVIIAAADPAHEDHAAAAEEFSKMFGDVGEEFAFSPVPFEIRRINEQLAEISGSRTRSLPELPGPLDELLQAVRPPRAKRQLRNLLSAASLDEPVDVDTETARRVVHPYVWLLDRVGTDGIKLTQAGYLPPRHVGAAMTELSPHDEWVGNGNREDLTIPVLELRESAQRLGLLRKYRGTLLLTRRGSDLADNPTALWTYLAQRTPPARAETAEHQAGLLMLLACAAEVTGHMVDTVAWLLGALGWASSDGGRLTPGMAVDAAAYTTRLLRRLGALTYDHALLGQCPTPDGITFARAALTSWPE